MEKWSSCGWRSGVVVDGEVVVVMEKWSSCDGEVE